MLYYRHNTTARHDPFLQDLTSRFGDTGYAVYFKTLEVYCQEFRPIPGWFLQTSMHYFKNEVGVYHTKKLKSIINYITSWSDKNTDIGQTFGKDAAEISTRLWIDRGVSSPHLSRMCPKWFVNLNDKEISIFIPNMLKFVNDYTLQRLRQYDAKLEDVFKTAIPSKAKQSIKKEPAETVNAADMAEGPMGVLFRTFLEVDQAAVESGADFPVGVFILKNLRCGIHPLALNDGLQFLVRCWIKNQTQVVDPWALAYSTAKSCTQKYAADYFDYDAAVKTYGPFFDNAGTREVNKNG